MFPVLRPRQEDCCAFEPSLGFRVSLTLLLSHEKRKVRRKKKRRRPLRGVAREADCLSKVRRM